MAYRILRTGSPYRWLQFIFQRMRLEPLAWFSKRCVNSST